MKTKTIFLVAFLFLFSYINNKLNEKEFVTLIMTASKKLKTKFHYSKGGSYYTIEMRFKETPKHIYIIESENYKLTNYRELSRWLEIEDTLRVQIKKSDLLKIQRAQNGKLEYRESCIEIYGLYSKKIVFLSLNDAIEKHNKLKFKTPQSFAIFILIILLLSFLNNYYKKFYW